MAPHQRRALSLLALTLAFGLLATPSAEASTALTIRAAKHAAVAKVRRLERKLSTTGADSSGVPGCWRQTSRKVGCLGFVRGKDDLVRWRCAVPMTVRRRLVGTASLLRHLSVEFTDTLCSF
jgi:hypothetical protein